MPKKVEKEPLLFIDTGYLGCYVNEQSYFKTPTEKPNDISNADYVHNYTQTDFFDFDEFKSLNDDNSVTNKQSLNPKDSKSDCDEEYEMVEILVDEESDDGVELNSISSIEAEADLLSNIQIEEIEVENDFVQEVTEIGDQSIDETQRVTDLVITSETEDEEIVDSEEDNVEMIDESQRELLLFIQDLTNLPSQMKAPIVQVVQKDGTLKSGILKLKDEQTVSIDNLMDESEDILIDNIEGIRILHM